MLLSARRPTVLPQVCSVHEMVQQEYQMNNTFTNMPRHPTALPRMEISGSQSLGHATSIICSEWCFNVSNSFHTITASYQFWSTCLRRRVMSVAQPGAATNSHENANANAGPHEATLSERCAEVHSLIHDFLARNYEVGDDSDSGDDTKNAVLRRTQSQTRASLEIIADALARYR